MRDFESDNNLIFQNFLQYAWFAGVVENISDPLQQGRVQVRCFGFHPDSKTLVPTTDLPWAHVALPTTSAGISGIGATHGLVEGSWVLGFFTDGREAQNPIVTHSVPGNPNPSRIQNNLINSGQSISSTAADGVNGLVQSVGINSVGGVTSTSTGVTASDAANSIDLSSYSNVLSSGLSGNITSSNTIQANTILSVVSSVNDLRASQIYNTITNNEKLNATVSSGSSIINYIQKYSNTTLASLLGVSKISNLNVNANNGTVDVTTNYEKALDNSTTQASLIIIQHNNIRKSAAALAVSKYNNLTNYHFVVTAQGQIFPQNDLSKSIDLKDGLATITSLGTTANTIRICMIGGLPDDSRYDNTAGIAERFTTAQLNATKRLVTILLKKYPKAIIDGSNNLIKNGSSSTPNFDVTSVFRDMFPNNVNVSANGTPIISGTTSVPANTQFQNIIPDTSAFHDPRGVLPAINYGPDYNAIARYNGVTNAKRNPPAIEAIKGNTTKFSTHLPRNAINRTAIGITTPEQIPTHDWGGEYGRSHVIHESVGGHAIYIDDTAGKERMVMASPTGAAMEMGPDGSIKHMSQGNFYQLAHNDHVLVTNGDSIETINGSKHIKIAGDLILEVEGRFNIVSKETNEFISGNKTIINEGIFKHISKAGHYTEVGRDFNLEVGGNKQLITAGTVADQAGLSRTTITTGGHTTKSNYSVDMTLGNRTMSTKGNLNISSNGGTNIFSKGDLLASTAGNFTSAATGAMKIFGASTEMTTGGKMSLNSGSLGVQSSGSMTFDGSHYSFDEGTQADKSTAPTITTFDYPAAMQPINPISNPESNPAAVDSAFGQRQEMEAHDEMGPNASSGSATRGSINSGSSSNSNAPNSTNSQTNMDPVSLGGSAGTGCSVAQGLVSRGMTEEAASGFAGGFMKESSFNTGALNPNDVGTSAYGIAQWRYERQNLLKSMYPDTYNTMDSQLDYVMYELKKNPGGVAGGAATMWQTSNLADGIKASAYYERFNGYTSAANGIFDGTAEWKNRAGYAASIYQNCFGKDPGVFNPTPSYNPNVGLNSSTAGINSSSPNTGSGPSPATRGSEKNVELPAYATKYTDRNQKISEFFTLADVLRSGGTKFELEEYYDLPSGRISADEIVANLSKVCVNVLDVISRNMGKVTVLSGLRPPWYNHKIGGAKNSQHMYGRATDIVVAGHSVLDVKNYVDANIPAVKGHGYYPGRFNHVDVRPQSYRTTWTGPG